MGKVIFNMTMSLDGGDALFNWYFSSDIKIPISDGNMVLRVSPQSAKLLI